jgi:acyl carrier protein
VKEQKLIQVVAAALGVQASALRLETAADEVEPWDSLGHINVISEIEAQFGVNIPIEDVGEIHRIEDFLPYLRGSA